MFCETHPVCRLTKWELVRLCGIYMIDQSPDVFEKYSYMANDYYSFKIKLLLVKLCERANDATTSVCQTPFSSWIFKTAVLQLTNCRLSVQAPKLFCYFRAQYQAVHLLVWNRWMVLVHFFLLFVANSPLELISELEVLREESWQKKKWRVKSLYWDTCLL